MMVFFLLIFLLIIPIPLFFNLPSNSPAKLNLKEMSRRNGKAPRLDLKLNLSPPRMTNAYQFMRESPRPSSVVAMSPTTSPPTSCLSSEICPDESSSSPEATSMVLVGCPRCLMYVMLSEDDPKCPKCKSTVLLDLLHAGAPATTARKR